MSELSSRDIIAKRVAKELCDYDVVNLGVGIPTLVTEYLGDKKIYLQTENGLLGMGPAPINPKDINPDLVDAGKSPVTRIPGASLFHSADSFAMIRGGHIDVAVLGTLQIDEHGEIANWAVPNQPILGVGGAMDLVAGAKKLIVAANLFAKDGSSKLIKELTFESSGQRKADLFVTEYAAFTFDAKGIHIVDIYNGMSYEELCERIGLPLLLDVIIQ